MNVRLLYTGRSYQTGQTLPDEITLADGAGSDDALRAINEMLPAGEPLPPTCLVTGAGQHLGTVASHAARQLRDGDEIVLIAPVAGG